MALLRIVHFPAPPPNVTAELRGERSRSKVARTADSPLETNTGVPTPGAVTHGRLQDHFYSSVQTGGGTLEGRPHPLLPRTSDDPHPLPRVPGEQQYARKPVQSKRRSSSRSKVSPMSPDDRAQSPSIPTSPEVFIGQGGAERLEFSSSSTQHPSSIKTAWGDLSQLDRYIEPTPGKEGEQGSSSRNGEGSRSREAEEGGRRKAVSRNDGEAPREGREWREPNWKANGIASTEDSGTSVSEVFLSDEQALTVSVEGNGEITDEGREKNREITDEGREKNGAITDEGKNGAMADEGREKNRKITDEGKERKWAKDNRSGTESTAINATGRAAISEDTAVSTKVSHHLVMENGCDAAEDTVTLTAAGGAESFFEDPSSKLNASTALDATLIPTNKSSAHTPDIASPEGVYIPSPRSHQSNSSYGGGDLDDSLTHQDHIHSLQQESSATLVAVSPAPKESRSSFAAHGLSKLSLAETSGKLYDFRSLKSPRGGASCDARTMEANWPGVDRRSERSDFSDANLVNVLPRCIDVNSAVMGKDGQQSTKPDSPGLLGGASSVAESLQEFDSTQESVSDVPDPQLDHSPVRKVARKSKRRSNEPLTEHKDVKVGHHMVGVDIPSHDISSPPARGEADIEHMRGKDVTPSVGGVSSHDIITPPARGEADIEHMRGRDVPPSVGGVLSLHDIISPPAYSSVLSTPVSYNAAVKSVHSTTASRMSGNSVNALKAIDLPPLRGVELTDVYLGKFPMEPEGVIGKDH